MNALTIVLDNLQGTPHYNAVTDALAKATIASLTVNCARLKPAENLGSETFSGSTQTNAHKGNASGDQSRKTWREKGIFSNDELIDHITGVAFGIANENTNEGGLEVLGRYTREDLIKMGISTKGFKGISEQDFDRVKNATKIYEYLRILKPAEKGKNVPVNMCRFIVKSSRVSVPCHIRKYSEATKVSAAPETFVQDVASSQVSLSAAS